MYSSVFNIVAIQLFYITLNSGEISQYNVKAGLSFAIGSTCDYIPCILQLQFKILHHTINK